MNVGHEGISSEKLSQLEMCIRKLQKEKLTVTIPMLSDKEAADIVISCFYNEIYCYMYKQTMDKELAMDLTQDIFIKMLQSIRRYDKSKASFRTWLYKIATNRLVDYYRSKSFRNQQLLKSLEGDVMDEVDFTLDIERKLILEQVIQCVNQLDATRQRIFRLKIFGGYSFLEIAQIIELPESTVKTKFYATQKLIRSRVQGG